MAKYRIVKEIWTDDSIYFYVERKFLFFWAYEPSSYFTRLGDAQEYIKSMTRKPVLNTREIVFETQ